MSSDQSAKDDEAQALKSQVYAAADGLLSRGIRPSLVLIEAAVSGPKRQLDHWLRDWAAHITTESNYCADPLLLVDRTQDPLISTSGNTAATRLAAAERREAAQRIADIDELNREIERARERLQKLEAGRKTLPASVEKARTRVSALEHRLAQLNKDHR